MARMKTPLALLVMVVATLSRSPVLAMAQGAADAIAAPAVPAVANLPRRLGEGGGMILDPSSNEQQPIRLPSMSPIPIIAGCALLAAFKVFDECLLTHTIVVALVCGAISRNLPPKAAPVPPTQTMGSVSSSPLGSHSAATLLLPSPRCLRSTDGGLAARDVREQTPSKNAGSTRAPRGGGEKDARGMLCALMSSQGKSFGEALLKFFAPLGGTLWCCIVESVLDEPLGIVSVGVAAGGLNVTLTKSEKVPPQPQPGAGASPALCSSVPRGGGGGDGGATPRGPSSKQPHTFGRVALRFLLELIWSTRGVHAFYLLLYLWDDFSESKLVERLVMFVAGMVVGGLSAPARTSDAYPPQPPPGAPAAGASPGLPSGAAVLSSRYSGGEAVGYEQPDEQQTWRGTGRAVQLADVAVETVAPTPNQAQTIDLVLRSRRLERVVGRCLLVIIAVLGPFLILAQTGGPSIALVLASVVAAVVFVGLQSLRGSPQARESVAADAPPRHPTTRASVLSHRGSTDSDVGIDAPSRTSLN